MRTFVICCLLAFPVAAQDAVTDAPVVKVRVEPAEPAAAPRVSAAAVSMASRQDAVAKPAPPAAEVAPTAATAPLSIEAALAQANAADVPRIVEAALAQASAADVPRIVAAIVATMERVSVPSSPGALEAEAVTAKVAASAVEVYAALYTATAKNVPPERLLELKSEWYQIFTARGGSKMWWILTKARELAERGEPVDRLKAAFDATLSAWMAEEE